MMNKKYKKRLMGLQTVQYPNILGDFSGSSFFAASQHSATQPKLQNRCIWVSYNITSKFKTKY